MNTRVSIIITTYNKAPYLRQSVESVLAQTHTQTECLIVDDGSTDFTPEVVTKLLQDYPQVQYFYKENGGISSTRNFGIDKASGDWIQFLDADDWIHPDKTRQQLASIPDLTQEAVVYSDYERVYMAQNDQISDRTPLTIGAMQPEQLVQRLLICPDFLTDTPFPLLQQAMLLKRSLFDHYRFDTRLKACEDREFVLTLLQQQVPFIYVPMTAAYYRKHQTNLTDNGTLMLDAYLTFFELMQQRDPDLQPQWQTSVRHLLENSIERQDTNSFIRLLNLVTYPVAVINASITVPNRLLLRLIFAIRRLVPNFLLYERYRGPRSRKLLAFGTRLGRTLGISPQSPSRSSNP
ncbi:MAG: glycosyltransferase [Cyanothece sp. SIO2G6]|nr:glycosyltransferase [Cyanothece sp. SIO2G6]